MTTTRGVLERAAQRGAPVDPVDLLARARLDAASTGERLRRDGAEHERPQRTGRVVLAIAAVLVVAVGAFVVAVRRSDDPSRLVAGPSVTRSAVRSIDGRMVPATTVAGDSVMLPLTLPDGRRYELSYPQGVDLAALGLRFFVQIDWPVSPQGVSGPPMQCCDRELTLSYTTVAELYPAASPISTYRGADGAAVLLLHGSQRRSPPSPYPTGDYLVFQFGPWVAEVWDSVPGSFAVVTPLDEAERVTFAAQLRADVDPDGFLVLRPQAPLKLADPRLVQLLFGDASTVAGTPSLTLSQFYCGQPESDTEARRPFARVGAESGVAWCDPITGFHVSASGSTDLTEAIGSGLEIRGLPPR